MEVGYTFLRSNLKLAVFPVSSPAIVSPVQRVIQIGDGTIQVPRHVAPGSDDPIEHVLFALKHEGINLQVLAETLPKINPGDLVSRLRDSPNSSFVRKACYLWENFTGQSLEDIPAAGGNYVDLFDPDMYITGPSIKDSKWRINFNGIGSFQYCPVVERTSAIEDGIKSDILGRTNDFLAAIGPTNADRALSWAYLSETENSFAIERETPSANKAEAFVALLYQAHEKQALTEDYLADLQSATISNPYDRAACFRGEQNWLRAGGLRGASSISFVPPPPALCRDLMLPFMEMANSLPATECDPIVAASVASFGFVFLHPFMDGNGRLSRFLFHHALCASGRLEKGLLLPVSVAMKRNETAYLAALQSYSKQARNLWEVRWLGDDSFDFKFTGSESVYRYWDATPGVEFGFAMSEQALDVHLKQETEFLDRFDRIFRIVNENFDIRNEAMHILITSAIQNEGRVSNNRRKQFKYQVPDEVFDFIQELVQRELGVLGSSPGKEGLGL